MKKRIILYLFVLINLLLSSCQSAKDDSKKNSKDGEDWINEPNDSIIFVNKVQFKNADIILGQLQKQYLSSNVLLNGQVEVPLQNSYNLSLPYGGFIKKLNINYGTKVKKGQVLLEYENPEFIEIQKNYLTYRENYKYLSIELNRKETLLQNQAISQKDYELFLSEYELLKINLKTFREKLLLININPDLLTTENISPIVSLISPTNGIITNVFSALGNYKTPTDIIAEIRSIEGLHLHLKAYEKYLGILKVGQNVWASTNYNPEKKYLCKIKLINSSFSSDKSVEVHCEFINTPPEIIPGYFMVGEIVISPREVYCLPEGAVLFYRGKSYIFLEDLNIPKHFDLIEVKTGLQNEDWIEILNSENLINRNIVVNGSYTLLMQMKNSSEEE